MVGLGVIGSTDTLANPVSFHWSRTANYIVTAYVLRLFEFTGCSLQDVPPYTDQRMRLSPLRGGEKKHLTVKCAMPGGID